MSQSRKLLLFCFIAVCLISVFVNAETKTKETPKPKPESIIPYHAIAMFVIWTVLVDLPLYAIKNLKSQTLHLSLFAVFDLCTLGSVGFAAYESINIRL